MAPGAGDEREGVAPGRAHVEGVDPLLTPETSVKEWLLKLAEEEAMKLEQQGCIAGIEIFPLVDVVAMSVVRSKGEAADIAAEGDEDEKDEESSSSSEEEEEEKEQKDSKKKSEGGTLEEKRLNEKTTPSKSSTHRPRRKKVPKKPPHACPTAPKTPPKTPASSTTAASSRAESEPATGAKKKGSTSSSESCGPTSSSESCVSLPVELASSLTHHLLFSLDLNLDKFRGMQMYGADQDIHCPLKRGHKVGRLSAKSGDAKKQIVREERGREERGRDCPRRAGTSD